jgi:lipoate-protein ligase B
MEQGVIDWLDSVGVDGTRRPGFPGVWVGTDKICAVGMHFRLGVSMHGIAINLTTDLAAFELITPCGITDGGITSLAQLGGTAPQPEDAAKQVGPLLIHNLHNPACTLARRSNQPG